MLSVDYKWRCLNWCHLYILIYLLKIIKANVKNNLSPFPTINVSHSRVLAAIMTYIDVSEDLSCHSAQDKIEREGPLFGPSKKRYWKVSLTSFTLVTSTILLSEIIVINGYGSKWKMWIRTNTSANTKLTLI